jgi:hypothetical protein
MKRLLMLPLLFAAGRCAPPPVVAPTVDVTVMSPADGDCDAWGVLLEAHGIPYDATAKRIMWRESRCSNVHTFSRRYRDDSFGPLQVNRWGTARGWDRLGLTADVMTTPDGAVAAAAVLYARCGWGPWTRPYRCPGGWPL